MALPRTTDPCMARYPQSVCVSGLFNAHEASPLVERCPVSVERPTKPDSALVPMSFQLMPPPKPPFPEVRKRVFHSVGRNRPKL